MGVDFNNPVKDPNYYLQEPSSIPPKFEGKAAEILGMEWSEQAYLNLYAGYTTDEHGNRQTKLPDYIRADRKGAIGITFTLPKNPSVAHQLGRDTRIDAVMTRAREAAMSEVERQFYVRSPFEQTGNLIWTTFRHCSSREGDPHSHDHVIIANLSLSKAKGRNQWKAIEMRYLDYAGIAKVYNDTLRQGFNELGYKTRKVGKEFDIVGVPSEVKAIFSKRHAAIEKLQEGMEANAKEFRKKKAVEKGMSAEDAERLSAKPMTSKAKSKLSVYDRPEKPDNKTPEERHTGWLAQLTDNQWQAVQFVVKKSLHAVKARSRDSFARWSDGISRYASQLRHNVLFQEPEAPERSRENGRSR